ncbi:MAG: rod shape-determining protein MreD [Acidimicrobiales bacterium]
MLSGLRFRLPLLLLFALVVHTTLLPSVRIAGVMPDLMLLVAVAAGLEAGPSYGAAVGFASGMLADLVLPTPLGLSALVFTLIGYAVGLAKAGLIRDIWWFPVIVAFAASSAGEGAFAAAGWMIGEEGLVNGHLTTIMLVVGIFNAVMAPAVLRVVRWALAGREPARAYAE